MAVPKRKLSRSRTHSRRSANRRLTRAPHSLCSNCGASRPPHTVCPSCGWYRDRFAVDVD